MDRKNHFSINLTRQISSGNRFIVNPNFWQSWSILLFSGSTIP